MAFECSVETAPDEIRMKLTGCACERYTKARSGVWMMKTIGQSQNFKPCRETT